MSSDRPFSRPKPSDGYLSAGGARLYYRDIGEGQPIIVLHGGPDFDHNYLVPEMDRLAESFRLLYYDQRGRGKSAEGVRVEDVSIISEMDDLGALQADFGVEPAAILGHSFGGLLAVEYATRHPERVSHLILMNTAPLSHREMLLFREHLRNLRSVDDIETMERLSASAAFERGSLDAEAEYYRIHFNVAVPNPGHVEEIVGRLRSNFTEETVRLARAIEERLYDETWNHVEYDLLPLLGQLDIPALVIHGDRDFVPVEVAARIAEAIPGAVLLVLPYCGHFAYLEYPDRVHEDIADFFKKCAG